MKALLLCAGYGQRLRPLTHNIPKCLVPICGKPLLQVWIERLQFVGITEFLINTHYLNDKVEEFIKSSEFSNKIKIVYENKLLGTAGTLVKNFNFYKNDPDVMLIHADNFCITNFKLFIDTHLNRPSQCDMTMMTFKTDDIKSSGTLILEDGVVSHFFEKDEKSKSNIANGAVYILSNKLCKWIKKNNYTDFSNEVIPELMNKIFTFHNKNIHIDIGTIKKYNLANEICKKNNLNK